MKIIPCEQGSECWMLARCGVVTASEFGNLMTPKWEIHKGEMVQTYLASKVAEKWIGGPLPGFSSWATEQGKIREEEAVPWYNLEFNTQIEQVGFITTDDGLAGCSPDGLLPHDGGGIEIKCPEPTAHTKYLLKGVLPDDYAPQVHFSMFVTGLRHWRFLSYRRGFPALVLTIERDEAIQEVISEALASFQERFDAAYGQIVRANGGPPFRRPKPAPATERVKFSWEMNQNEVPV